MGEKELPATVRARILAALEHDANPRVDTASFEAVVAPDGASAIVFYDRWEFHMGAETAKIALVDRDGAIVRRFPFEARTTSSHLAAYRGDSAAVAIALGSVVAIWSLTERRFAVVGIGFSASSLEWTADALLVRESTYRVAKAGGYYADGPAGARFELADLVWHGEHELPSITELFAGAVRQPARELAHPAPGAPP
jgi:hypothetical protein